MHLRYLNGTAQQRRWLEEAIGWTFDWTEHGPDFSIPFWDVGKGGARAGEPPHIDGSVDGVPALDPFRLFVACACMVDVQWVPQSEIPEAPGTGGLVIFAETHWTGQPGWFHATISIDEGLDTRGGPFGGQAFYKETCLHEFMHVLQAMLEAEERDTLTGLFGGAPWNTGPWGNQVQEVVAETMKDTLAGAGQKVYDNRTNLTLRYDDLLELFRPFTGESAGHGVPENLPPEGLDPRTLGSVGYVGGPDRLVIWSGADVGVEFPGEGAEGGRNPPASPEYGAATPLYTYDSETEKGGEWEVSVEVPALGGTTDQIGIVTKADFVGPGYMAAIHRLWDGNNDLVLDTNPELWDVSGNLWLPPDYVGSYDALGRRWALGSGEAAIPHKRHRRTFQVPDNQRIPMPLTLTTRYVIVYEPVLVPPESEITAASYFFNHRVLGAGYGWVPQYSPRKLIGSLALGNEEGGIIRTKQPVHGNYGDAVAL